MRAHNSVSFRCVVTNSRHVPFSIVASLFRVLWVWAVLSSEQCVYESLCVFIRDRTQYTVFRLPKMNAAMIVRHNLHSFKQARWTEGTCVLLSHYLCFFEPFLFFLLHLIFCQIRIDFARVQENHMKCNTETSSTEPEYEPSLYTNKNSHKFILCIPFRQIKWRCVCAQTVEKKSSRWNFIWSMSHMNKYEGMRFRPMYDR